MEQPLYELPEGWRLATLPKVVGENGLFTDGDWVESKDQDPSGDVRLIQLADIGVGEYRDRSSRFLTYDKAKELNCSFLRPNDILFARMPDPIGRACLFPGDEKQSVTVVDVAIIRPASKLVNANWLVYQINSPQFHASVVALQKGATRKRISRKNLATIQFPLPPLNEQKRIVARLDALFTRIDAAITHLQETLELSKALFASALDEVIQLKSGNERQVKLGDVSVKVSTGPFGSMLHKSDYVSKGVPLVNPINMIGNKIIADKKKQVSLETKKRLGNYVLNVGDVVIARRGEIGRCAVVQPNQANWVCGTGCFFLTPGDHANPEYVAYLLRSSTYRSKLESQATGATIKNISNKGLAGLEISLPPVKEQERAVAHIKNVAEHTRTLEAETQERLDQLAALKSSLLDAAFRGQL